MATNLSRATVINPDLGDFAFLIYATWVQSKICMRWGCPDRRGFATAGYGPQQLQATGAGMRPLGEAGRGGEMPATLIRIFEEWERGK